jgi:hypothetical protein
MPESEVVAWLDDEESEQLFPLSEVIRLVRLATDQHAVATGASIELMAPWRERVIDEFRSYTLSRGMEY